MAATAKPRVLRKTGQATRYRSFPVRRERPGEGGRRKTEYQVYLGFDSQKDAERWIDDAVGERLLAPATEAGSPGRPQRRPARVAD